MEVDGLEESLDDRECCVLNERICVRLRWMEGLDGVAGELRAHERVTAAVSVGSTPERDRRINIRFSDERDDDVCSMVKRGVEYVYRTEWESGSPLNSLSLSFSISPFLSHQSMQPFQYGQPPTNQPRATTSYGTL